VKSIDERLSFLEEKLQHYRRGQEHDSISRRRNQTLPSQSLNTITQNRNRLNELTERLKNVDFDQNISLNEEVRISQDHFNRSVPAQLHFPIHSTSKNSRNKALNNRAEPIKIRNNIEPNPLEEIQSRLDSIKHNFDLGRGDVLNQPGVSSYASANAHDLMSELKRKEDELEKLRLEQERLNHIRNEIRKNDLARSKSPKNDNLEQASVMVECGTPHNRRAQRIDWEAESVASSVDGRTRTISDSIENDRMSRVERLLMQTIGRLESQDEQLKVLKNKLDLTENTNRFASSTPFSKEKRAPQREKTQNRVEREMKKVVKVHEKNPAFLLSLLPLLSIANSDDIRSNILKVVEAVVEGKNRDDDYTQSEFDISDTEDDFHLDAFLNSNLTDLVKKTVEPVMADFIAKGTPEAPITKNELEIILTKLVKNCGANKLKQEVKNRFVQSIRDPMLRFVGQPNSRDKMFIEISEVLFNEIRYVRTLVGGHPFTVGVEELENDEDAPRHISHVDEDDVQVDKNISLSVAEVKALTCYGSGEDEESNPSNDDDSSADENPQTEINKEKSPDSSNSSPVIVSDTEKKE